MLGHLSLVVAWFREFPFGVKGPFFDEVIEVEN
jgi:hypothetical protein